MRSLERGTPFKLYYATLTPSKVRSLLFDRVGLEEIYKRMIYANVQLFVFTSSVEDKSVLPYDYGFMVDGF